MEFDVCCPRDIQAVAIGDAELWLLQNAVDRSPFLAGFHGTPFLEPLRTLVHCKPKLDWGPKEQGMLCAIAANGLWPQERLHSIGAVDNDKCRLCPFDIGTQRHRAWQCVGTRAYREQYGLPQSAGVDQRQRFLWNFGLLTDPTVWLPRPASACAIIWDVAPTDGLFHGEAYGDGSTFNGTYAATARSGWAVTQVEELNGEMRVVAAARGALPGLVQGTPPAEAFSFLQHLSHAGLPPHSFASDCEWVRSSWLAGPAGSTGG